MPITTPATSQPKLRNRPAQVLFASLIGTAVEFFDFYIYATAAVLVFPALFFPKANPASAILLSLATFAVAFIARPIGAALFGHFGDRIGRKATLVVALSTMGISTFAIGALPTFTSIGLLAPLLLTVCRFGQGIGLGGEWGGAILLAIENAPPRRRAWYGMFPQFGAPLGFFLSGGVFFLLSHTLSNAQFFAFGWRLPFLSSAVLVLLGLYVRLTITETPVFTQAENRGEKEDYPFLAVFHVAWRSMLAGILICLATFVLFYLMTVFTLSWGTSHLGFSRERFLLIQLFGVIFFALTIPIAAFFAEKSRRAVMLSVQILIFAFGLALGPLFSAGQAGASITLVLGLGLMGLTYGPLGTVISEIFPTSVRYTGSSLAFSLAGILGASLAPSIATWLALHFGLNYVGYYLSFAAMLSFLGLLLIRETKGVNLASVEL
jgi:metabolite-proton symporter